MSRITFNSPVSFPSLSSIQSWTAYNAYLNSLLRAGVFTQTMEIELTFVLLLKNLLIHLCVHVCECVGICAGGVPICASIQGYQKKVLGAPCLSSSTQNIKAEFSLNTELSVSQWVSHSNPPDSGFAGDGVTDMYRIIPAFLHGCWDLNSGLLQEQQVLLSAESSLQTLLRVSFL